MKPLAEMNFAEGEVLLFNKPETWTSFDVVKKIRGIVRVKKVGHAGTLDPLATGLLILCTGKKTKSIESIQNQEKEYVVEIRLGATTASYDRESEPENFKDTSHITREQIEQVIREQFLGEIEQFPPIYSAVRIKGKRAYELARKGKKVEMKPRRITLYAFDIENYAGPESITARIRCSKGTYIRSIAHDLGQALGTGGYMAALTRTRIGDYALENAFEIDHFASEIDRMRGKSPHNTE